MNYSKRRDIVSKKKFDDICKKFGPFRMSFKTKYGVTPGKIGVDGYLNWMGINKDLNGKRILDIGCWNGGMSFACESLGAEVVAIDVMPASTSHFDKLHNVLNSKVSFAQASCYQLDEKQFGKFDICIFNGVFYHLKHPVLALEKINSVMKPKGILLGSGTSLNAGFWDDHSDNNNGDVRKIANETSISGFVRTSFLGDRTNWWIPSQQCVSAWLHRAGFKESLLKTYHSESNDGKTRSVCRFIAEKISLPDEEFPHDIGGPENEAKLYGDKVDFISNFK
jgi:SAM-dependent methyltransferase